MNRVKTLQSLHYIILALLLSGCAGAGAMLSTKETIHPNAYFISHGSIKIDSQVSAMRHLGNPEEVVTYKSGSEKWNYNKSIAWRGVYIVVILPVPLMLPVGHNKLSLHFASDGKLIDAISESADDKGCVTILLLSGCLPDTFI